MLYSLTQRGPEFPVMERLVCEQLARFKKARLILSLALTKEGGALGRLVAFVLSG